MKALALALTICAGSAAAQELTIATGGHYPPFIFDPATPQAMGLDKDVVDEICRRGGYTCTWVDLPMDGIFQALARGDVDIVTGGFGYSTDRDAIVDFTCPYVLSGDERGTFLAVDEDVDLINDRIGVLVGSLYEAALRKAGRNVVTFPTEEDAIAALIAGQVDVTFGSRNMEDEAGRAGALVKVGEYPTFSGGSVLGVAETAPDLLRDLDNLLAEISADGTLERLHIKWFGFGDGDVIARCMDPTPLT